MHSLVAWLFTGIVLLNPVEAFPQSATKAPDFRKIFGSDYEWAVQTIKDNSGWADTLRKDGIDPDFALAVIFPELIRYSSIADYIEIKALEVLYVQYGADYADFSVGLFQMKPTFAEQVEADLLKFHLDDSFPGLSALDPKTNDGSDVRKARIIRLKDEYYQLLYLEAFIRAMDTLYPEMNALPDEEKLGFYATAYNTGYWKGEAVIRRQMEKAFFYSGMNEAAKKYIYADLSVDCYLKMKAREK